jgi:hypothetical protein
MILSLKLLFSRTISIFDKVLFSLVFAVFFYDFVLMVYNYYNLIFQHEYVDVVCNVAQTASGTGDPNVSGTVSSSTNSSSTINTSNTSVIISRDGT